MSCISGRFNGREIVFSIVLATVSVLLEVDRGMSLDGFVGEVPLVITSTFTMIFGSFLTSFLGVGGLRTRFLGGSYSDCPLHNF